MGLFKGGSESVLLPRIIYPWKEMFKNIAMQERRLSHILPQSNLGEKEYCIERPK